MKILGEKIAVRAQVYTLGDFSAHAGQSDLLKWVGTIAPNRPRMVLVHGDDIPRTTLAQRIREEFGLASELPKQNGVIEG